ncbi:hypothetical protein KSS87_007681, partial [Heliosperma pusillum]
WVIQGAVDVDIGANPSAEGGEDEGVDDQAVKVVDIVDTFRLQKFIKNLTPKLDDDAAAIFKKNVEPATKFLMSKLSDLQFFVGESMHDDGATVFAYYKEGAADPTFLYFAHGLREIGESLFFFFCCIEEFRKYVLRRGYNVSHFLLLCLCGSVETSLWASATSLLGTEPLPNLNQVYSRLIQEEGINSYTHNPSDIHSEPMAFAARVHNHGHRGSGGGSRSHRGADTKTAPSQEHSEGGRPYCFACKRFGHVVSTCFRVTMKFPEWWGDRPRERIFLDSIDFSQPPPTRGSNGRSSGSGQAKAHAVTTGDELLSDSFPYNELFEGVLWEVEGKWVIQGAVDVDIGANPSAEGGEDEGVDDQAVKVVDIVDTFRLQEQPAFDKKTFVGWVKKYIKNLTLKLDDDAAAIFKKNVETATKFLMSKLRDLQFFVGESMHDDGATVFAYYKDGAADPTFLYFAHGLREVKC